LIIDQSGPDVTASILRVDGDSGAATGVYDGSKFVLGHFSGARPLRLELLPQADGTLTVEQDSWYTYTARRADEALAKGLPQPADPSRYSRVKDPGARFEFSFPDIENHLVTNTDARFRRKVVIVTIGGSWCPNCHDEAPFLMELYRTYRDRGLEIVFLSFEEAQQLKGLEQLRAFIKRYDIEYPVLIAGDTRLVRLRLPQVVNLEAFPTTLFLGRDGSVREVHAGFAGAATGPYHTSLKAEMRSTVERLLEEQ
jgi:thiol-disulfide isomerase/thioredoxin